MWATISRYPAVWIPFALGASIAVGLTYRENGAVEMLVGAIGLMVLVACTVRPLWGVCLAALFDLWFSYVQALGVPPRNYVVLYLLGFAAVHAMRVGAPTFPRSAHRLVLAVGFLAGLAALQTLISSGDNILDTLYGIGAGLGAGLAIALVTARFVSSERDAFTFVRFVTVVVTLSAVVALLQSAGIEAAWQLRERIGVSGLHIAERARVPGLTYFSIQLSYQLATLIPIIGSIWLSGTTGPVSRKMYGLACATLGLALAATLSRSGLAGAVLGMLVVIALSQHRRRWLWLGMIALASVGIVTLFDLSGRRDLSLAQLILDRWPHFITAVWIAWDNPLGIGSLHQFTQYASYYYSEIADIQGASVARYQTAHNQFLNVLVAYGLPFLVVFVWFYRELFVMLNRVRKRAAPASPRHALAVGLIGSFVGYQVNASFHNPGPFTGDLFNWYCIGLAVALARMDQDDAAKPA